MAHVIYLYLLPIKPMNFDRTVPYNVNSSKLKILGIGLYCKKFVFTKA